MVLPAPCLVVLVGPSGSGKSSWAATHFAPEQIVSSDALRAVVGVGDADLSASADVFVLLEQIVDARARPPAHDSRRHARPRRRPAGAVGCTRVEEQGDDGVRGVRNPRGRVQGSQSSSRQVGPRPGALATGPRPRGATTGTRRRGLRHRPRANRRPDRARPNRGGPAALAARQEAAPIVPTIWAQDPRVSRPGGGTAAAIAGDCGSGRSQPASPASR